MHGDFSRDTFVADNPFSRVLKQQGRIDSDADWNEQVGSLLYSQRALFDDLIGWHGCFKRTITGIAAGIEGADSFFLDNASDANNVKLKGGTYYVHGRRVTSPDMNLVANKTSEAAKKWLFMLDVWERTVCPAENAVTLLDPPQQVAFLEPALQGVDTCARGKIERAVRVVQYDAATWDPKRFESDFLKSFSDFPDETLLGTAAISWDPRQNTSLPCANGASSPQPTTALYRVEVHVPGTFRSSHIIPAVKWSRNNGSQTVAGRVHSKTTSGVLTVAVAAPPYFDKSWFRKGTIVELQTERTVRWNPEFQKLDAGQDPYPPIKDMPLPGATDPDNSPAPALPLFQVLSFQKNQLSIQPLQPFKIPDEIVQGDASGQKNGTSCWLRIWDHHPDLMEKPWHGCVELPEEDPQKPGYTKPILIDGALSLRFQLKEKDNFKQGDYWLIPIRPGTGPITTGWTPSQQSAGLFERQATRVMHYYAPLAIDTSGAAVGIPFTLTDVRRTVDISLTQKP